MSFHGVLMELPLMLHCKDAEEFLLDYLDGNLPAGQRAKFLLHMASCRACRRYIAAYKKSVQLGQAFFGDPDAPVPDDMPEDLVTAILDSRDAPET